MICPKDIELEDYARGRLSGAVEKNIREHVEVCQSCQSRIQSVKTDESMLLKAMSALMDEEAGRCTTIASLKKGAKNEHFISSAHGSRIRLDIAKDKVLGDRYQIVRELGQSGRPVYQAHDLELRCDVALKIVVVDPDRAETTVRQLRQELQLRTRISDFKNIIKAFDIHPLEFEGFSLVVLAMEYADGGSLRPWLSEHHNDGDKRIEEGISLLIQACQGCRAAHDHGVVHLDIKPENILLCRVEDQLIAKLSDFGISRILTQVPTTFSEDLLLVAGTPPYMSPEQFDPLRKQVGVASDTYSLGVVLFEILTGKPPFVGTYPQLRDQHLNAPPPALKGDVSRWSRVVEKCLAKRSEERYSNVGQLAADLLRGQMGHSLSLDIACPECGSINIDPTQVDCDRCKKELPDAYFRPCPRCFGGVRLDQEDCPRCGRRGVAAYYLLQERREAIERLKDEAPAEAIELLEVVLREGAVDFETRAEELIRELRGKQKSIEPLAAKAQEAASAGRVEEAINTWGTILDIVPRHRIATNQRDRLRTLLREFDTTREKAISLMDKAAFEEAEERLQRCLELKPTCGDARNLFETCRHRSQAYNKAFEDASAASASKLLVKAQAAVQKAIEQAPKSSDALALSKRLSATQQATAKLILQIREDLPQAKFAAIDKCVRQVEELQADNQELATVKAEADGVRTSYSELMDSARKANEACHLEEVVHVTAKALGNCPKSPEAQSLSSQAKTNQKNTMDLVEQAKAVSRKADFEATNALLKQASQLWANFQALRDCENTLLKIRTDYDQSMARARQANEEKQLPQAVAAAKAALEKCPESANASKLLGDIEKRQSQVHECLAKWQQFLETAEFQKAREQVEHAERLWPSHESVSSATEKTDSIASMYAAKLADAKSKFERTDYGAAEIACDAALGLCRRAQEPKHLKDRIDQSRKQQWLLDEQLSKQQMLIRSMQMSRSRRRRELAVSIALTCAKWTGILVGALAVLAGAGFGLYLLWVWITGTVLTSIGQTSLWKMAVRHQYYFGIIPLVTSVFFVFFSMIRNTAYFCSRIEESKDYEDYREVIFKYYLVLIVFCMLPSLLVGVMFAPGSGAYDTVSCLIYAAFCGVLSTIFWWIRRRR